MDWKHLTQSLIKSGLTQAQLAKLVGCGQATISDILTGKTEDPRSSVCVPLMTLAIQRLPPQPWPWLPERRAQQEQREGA